MSASHTVAQKKAAAQTAVAAKPVSSSSKATANGPLPLPDDGTALRTPSWTAIVEAYHREGNGDREMLLALLHAKAKEDERLAALDLLRAEQLRAYTTHIAVHGPLLYPGVGAGSPISPTSNGASSSPKAAGGAMPMPMNGQALGAQATFAHPPHHHHHAHPHAHAHAYYAAAAAAAAPPPARAHAASTSAGSTASTSSSAASSSSSRGRKHQATNSQSQPRNQTRDNASRSPSLSHTAESRLSSPESIARTPIDERRLSDFALAASAISEKERGIATKDGGLLVVPSLNAAAAAAAAGKRKAGSMEIDDQQDENDDESIMTISAARPSKRASPARSLPSISTSLPTPTSEEDGSINAGQQQQSQRRASTSPKLAHAKRSSSPRSLQQILNSELRPLSLSSFKVATSDLRSSASDDEDELADE